jgi:hypothetical protein
MSEYTIEKVGERYAVVALGCPQLSFDTLAEAKAAVADIAALPLQPAIHRPDEQQKSESSAACVRD